MNQETKQEIQEVLRQVASCPIHIGWQSNQVGAGERKSCYRGSGFDFDSTDDFEAGDDPRDIDWKATAQTGGQQIIKKIFRQEREVKVFILQDVNPSMNFGTVRATKRRLSAELAASICRSAGETHDKVGFFAYSQSEVEAYVPPRGANSVLTPILASIFEAPASPPSAQSGLIQALKRLPATSKALVFILSDFLNLTQEEKAALARAALKHDVICLIVQDRRERELPPGWGPLILEDMRTGERTVVFLTDGARKSFAANFQRHQEQLNAFLKSAHCTWLVASTEEGQDSIRKVIRLFASH